MLPPPSCVCCHPSCCFREPPLPGYCCYVSAPPWLLFGPWVGFSEPWSGCALLGTHREPNRGAGYIFQRKDPPYFRRVNGIYIAPCPPCAGCCIVGRKPCNCLAGCNLQTTLQTISKDFAKRISKEDRPCMVCPLGSKEGMQ